MKQLEILHPDSTFFGLEIERANRNFSKISGAIQSLELKYSHDKGWFPSEQRLKISIPQATVGDFAYVKGEYYYWTSSEGWTASGILAKKCETGILYPYFPKELPVYYKGDSVKIVIGILEDYFGAYKAEANVFVKSSNKVTAVFPKSIGSLDIRQDTKENELYFVIPESSTRKMDLGEQILEFVAWFKTGTEGEDYVKRTRRVVFELQEYETIK